MSPTVFRQGAFRFYFFSREESRMHVHVNGPSGEAKFWMEPLIELAVRHGFSDREINTIRKIVEENEDRIVEAWREHFEG